MAGGVAGTARGQIVRWAAALAIGALAGYVCTLLHTPIPWMLGPLFAIAALRVVGVDLEVPLIARYAGQWIIGTSLGLYFTPVVVRHVGDLWYLPIIGACSRSSLGYVVGRRARASRRDSTRRPASSRACRAVPPR